MQSPTLAGAMYWVNKQLLRLTGTRIFDVHPVPVRSAGPGLTVWVGSQGPALAAPELRVALKHRSEIVAVNSSVAEVDGIKHYALPTWTNSARGLVLEFYPFQRDEAFRTNTAARPLARLQL